MTTLLCAKSKAICVIILWIFLAYICFYFSIRASVKLSANLLNPSTIDLGYSAFFAFNYLLYPLGGLMGDIVCGRYKLIKRSLMFLLFISIMLIVSGSLLLVDEATGISIMVYGFLVLISVIGLVPFFANIIPFALDQLRDLPSQDSSVFICWYVWTLCTSYVFSSFILAHVLELSSVVTFAGTYLITISVLVLVTVIISLLVTGQRPEWFNVEPCHINPYKLVYKVTRFAYHHKIPIRRSAFTYCEDDPPSRLDLGKSKYGGPFTTEEVEDVKVFYEILRVLVILGPFMYVFHPGMGFLESHLVTEDLNRKIGFIDSYALVAMGLPLYLYLRGQRFRCLNCLPAFQSLRKIEIGMIVVLLQLVFSLLVDIAAHTRNENLACMFVGNPELGPEVFSPVLVTLITFVREMLAALSLTILYTSFLEFVCAQSPQPMKGMLVGLTYAILIGLFGLLKVTLIIPFGYWKWLHPSCGFVYFSINLIICLVAFIVFVWVAKGYKYRQRDEPSRVRQYAEDYYSSTLHVQQQPYCDTL